MPRQTILPYIPAQYYETKKCSYVAYYVLDPATGKYKRKKIKLNHIKSKKTRRQYARELIIELNKKLAEGWNPFIQSGSKSYVRLLDALDMFFFDKERELRKRSLQSYRSQANVFIRWVKKQDKEFYVGNFTETDAADFMRWYWQKGIRAKTYNTMKSFLVTVWEWFIENSLANRNVFKGIKKKKEQSKIRQIIPTEIIQTLKQYLKEREPEFYVIFLLCYHGLLRPNEITQLKPKYFNIAQKVLILPPEVSKNNKKRVVSLSNELVAALKDIEVESMAADVYMFSTGFKPGEKPIHRNRISEFWGQLRQRFDLPSEYQFYSLKDTGIVNMIRAGISLEAIRDQAGHSSLEMTNRYVQIARQTADKQIIDKINF